jgi:transposase
MRLDNETDPKILRQAVTLLEKENQKLTQKIVELMREIVTLKGGGADQVAERIADLEKQLASKNQLLFGASSEKRPGDKSAEDSASEQSKPPRTGHGPKAQPKLPVVEVVHQSEQADTVCKSCGGQLDEWEGQFEESEEIDVIERRFVVQKHKRQKYRCRCNACIETAPGPLKLFEGARYSIDFAIEVATDKYCDHNPLERQVRKMEREGLDVDSQTLWDQTERVARLLTPAYIELNQYILDKPVIGADETRWPLLGKKNNKPSQWHAWAIASPDAVAYQIHDGRSVAIAKKVLGEFMGIVVCDGYGVYKSLANSNGLTLAHCWAHVRRAFIKAEKDFPAKSKVAVELIRDLYEVEALCPAGPEGDTLRSSLRQERSKRIVEELFAYAEKTVVVPGSSLEDAFDYMAKLKSGLERFLSDPRIPIDNNLTERSQRGIVVGRKNHYGSRSRRGTEVAALFYSFVESAKLCGLEPKAYLKRAVIAALRGERIPLPHEIAASP